MASEKTAPQVKSKGDDSLKRKMPKTDGRVTNGEAGGRKGCGGCTVEVKLP